MDQPIRRFCTRCAGEIMLVDMGGIANLETHYSPETCIEVLQKRVMDYEARRGLALTQQETVLTLAALRYFFSALPGAGDNSGPFGQYPAVLMGLLGMRAGEIAFTEAVVLDEHQVAMALKEWYLIAEKNPEGRLTDGYTAAISYEEDGDGEANRGSSEGPGPAPSAKPGSAGRSIKPRPLSRAERRRLERAARRN